MKQIKQQLLLTVALLLCGIGIANAEIFTDSCGKDVTCTFNTETGLLEIKGTGPTNDYQPSKFYEIPWILYVDSVKEVRISDGVTHIGSYFFYHCKALTSVSIPNSVTSIGDFAFVGCEALPSISIPNSVTSIGGYAFMVCRSLTSITIPKSVKSIGRDAFLNCHALSSVTIPNGVTSIGSGAFINCDGLTSINIPSSVTTIEIRTFAGCSGLTRIEIPNSITSIEEKAFADCSGLTRIEIPNSVTSIEESAFANCSNIKDIVSLNTVPPSSAGSLPTTATVHVLSGCKDAYMTSSAWNAYNIVDDAEMPKCAAPVITLIDGEIICSSTTVSSTCHHTYEITNTSGSGTNSSKLTSTLVVKAYATANGFRDSEITTEIFDINGNPTLKGDINGDGKVTMQDVNKIVNNILGR